MQNYRGMKQYDLENSESGTAGGRLLLLLSRFSRVRLCATP